MVPNWPAPGCVRAFMTTRAGGTSHGPYDAGTGSGAGNGMNLGRSTGDDLERVEANRARLRRSLPAEPRWLRQVHGATVVDAAQVASGVEADASFTVEADVVCVVSVADCMPVLLADAAGRGVAAAHAGWRGLAAGVIQNTAQALRVRIGDPGASILAWLGPAIGPTRFEVGPEVRTAMSARLPRATEAFAPQADGKFLADLGALARQALAQVGVSAVHGGAHCTHLQSHRFYSFRRDRTTGRHAALIWLDRQEHAARV
jgi:YfiH family protein